MNANCVICADSFDETKEIVAAPCGHVYHASCLTTWVRQSNSCPQCRSRTYARGILKLYFNFLPQSEKSISDLENEIVALTSRLNAKESELRACKQEKDDQYTYLCSAEENTTDLYRNICELQREVDKLREKARSLSILDAKIFDLEQINAALTNDLEHFRSIHAVVSGSQKDVEDILREHSSRLNSVEQLATYCACLKRELIETVHNRNNLMQFNSKLTYENSIYAAKLKFYEDAMGIHRTEFKENVTAPATPASELVSENVFMDTPCASRDCVDEGCLSPVSVMFNRNKLNFRIEASNGVCKPATSNQTNLEYSNAAPGTMRKNDDCAIIRIRYGGVDGHGKITASSKLFQR